MPSRLPIDLLELAASLDSPRGGPVRTFFDRITGALEPMPRDAEVEGVFDDIVAAPERWVEVRPLPLSERLSLRRRFVEEVVVEPVERLRFFDALAAPRPLAAFEALLRANPALLDAWQAHRADRLAAPAILWLSALGVEPL
jgi:hypothetical protein